MRAIYRLLSLLGDVKAAGRGPGAFGRRYVRKAGHRGLARVMRKVLRP